MKFIHEKNKVHKQVYGKTIETFNKCRMCEIVDWKRDHIKTMCPDCRKWRLRLKKKCPLCEKEIRQNFAQRKKRGNWCVSCIRKVTKK